jgi:hypothetical protein
MIRRDKAVLTTIDETNFIERFKRKPRGPGLWKFTIYVSLRNQGRDFQYLHNYGVAKQRVLCEACKMGAIKVTLDAHSIPQPLT